MPTTNDLLETINSAITTGSYTTYTPESWTTSTTAAPFYASTTFTPNAIYMSNQSIDETIKEATEKVDKHVDQLEEDIEFLNEKREKLEYDLNELRAQHFKTVSELTMKIDKLETDNANLITRLLSLEDVLDDCVSKLRGKLLC